MKLMEVTEVSIGEYNFYIRPFPAFRAANIMGDLASFLLPVLGAILPLADKVGDGDLLDADVEDVLPALSKAMSDLSGDEVERVLKKLLVDNKNVSIEGEATDDKTQIMTMDLANEAFCGDIWGMLRLCWEVIKINYGGTFFEKFKGTPSGGQSESTKTTKSQSGVTLTSRGTRTSK